MAGIDAGLRDVFSKHSGRTVGRNNASIGGILCKGEDRSGGALRNANVDLAIRKGKVELSAARDHHAHPGRVFSEVGIGAVFHAVPSGVEAVVGSGALRNAHLGSIIGVVMQA